MALAVWAAEVVALAVRAAPKAALDWGAEEFDLPPSPRNGPGDLDEPELGMASSGAGHLRAAGLRL